MKPIIATVAAITLAAGMALAGSAATAGSSITFSQNGVTYSTSNHNKYSGTRGHHRSLGKRHELHTGHPFLGSSKRHGVSKRSLHRSHKFNNRHSKRRSGFRRY